MIYAVTSLVAFLFISFVVTMGLMIRWEHERDYSKRTMVEANWHIAGWLFRLGVHVIISLIWFCLPWHSHILLQLVVLGITWTGFDMLLNMINGWGQWYIGDSKINTFVLRYISKKTFWAVRIAIWIGVIVALILT